MAMSTKPEIGAPSSENWSISDASPVSGFTEYSVSAVFA
jgi:hypothetical protein